MPDSTQQSERIILREQSSITQVIGQPPGWITRWGITLVFLIVAVLFLLSYLVKFPDRIPAEVVITTENPPIRVVAQKSAKIQKLLVTENKETNQNEILAIMENTADYEDVLALEKFVEAVEKNTEQTSRLVKMEIPKQLKIGVLSPGLALFQKDFRELTDYLKKNRTYRKIRKLDAQVVSLNKLIESHERQIELLEEEVELAQINYDRYDQLEKGGSASKKKFEGYKEKLLQVMGRKEQLGSDIHNYNISIEKIEMEILNLKTNKSFSEDEKLRKLDEDVLKLQTAIENWKKENLLIAPITGKVAFTDNRKENSFIKAGESLLTVVPEDANNEIVGKAYLKTQGSGKVKVGQPINIRLDGYNFQEYGIIKATVEQISLVPNGDQYQLDINIPDTLITTYDREIPFRQEMKGVGYIITEDRRIINRIFDKILSLIWNR